jgi:hypothetical protein
MSMTGKVTIETDYLLVTTDGTFDVSDAKQLFERALDAAVDHQMRKILFDWRAVTGTPTTMDRFDLASHLAAAYHQRSREIFIRFALVGVEPLVDPQRFGETVAVNRGVPGKVTTDMSEAVAWLHAYVSDERPRQVNKQV